MVQQFETEKAKKILEKEIQPKLDDLEAKLDDSTHGLSALKALIDALEGKLDHGTHGLASIKTEIQAIEGKLDDASFGLANIKAEIEAIETKLDDPATGLATIKAEVTAIEAKLDNASFGLANIKAEIEAVEAKLDARLDVAVSSRALESGGRLQSVQTDLENAEFIINFPSAEALDDIAAVGPTNTTTRSITVTLPTGASIIRVMLAAFITVMNDTANAQKIDVDVQGRLPPGAWVTYFSQDDCIGFPAADGATTGLVALQDVSALVTAAATYEFRLSVVQSSANSIHYTTQYVLLVTYSF